MKRMKTLKQITKRVLSFALVMSILFSPSATVTVNAAAEGESGENSPQITAVRQVSPSEMKNGGYYVLAINNMDCRYNDAECLHEEHTSGGKTYAMANYRNGYTYADNEGYLLDHVFFDGSLETTTEDLIWKYEEYEGGYSFRAYSVDGEDNYLHVEQSDSKFDLTLGTRQAMTIAAGDSANTIHICYGNNFVRFNTNRGGGYGAGTNDWSHNFVVYEVTIDNGNEGAGGGDEDIDNSGEGAGGGNEDIDNGGEGTGGGDDGIDNGSEGTGNGSETGDEQAPKVTAVKQVSPSEMKDGAYYVLAVAGMDCFYGGGECLHLDHTPGGKTYAMTNGNSGYTGENGYLLDHEVYDGSVEKTTDNLIWQYEKYRNGVSFRAYSAKDENKYLNFQVGSSKTDLTLGAQQALTITAGAKDKTINITYDKYFIYFTSGSGSGYKAAPNDYSNDFLVYEVTIEGLDVDDKDEDTDHEVELPEIQTIIQIDPYDMRDGGYYVLAVAGMDCFYGNNTCLHPDHTPGGKTYAMTNENSRYTGENGLLLDHEVYDGTIANTTADLIWQYKAYNGGASFRAYSVEGEDNYLNFQVDGTRKDLTLGAQQALKILDGAKEKTINIAYDKYFIYFTSGSGSGYKADTKDYSNDFRVYEVIFKGEGAAEDKEEEREKPLYTIAAVSDMHMGYGDNPYVMRQGTLNALAAIKEKENPDMVLSGGDMIGYNGSAKWTKELYDQAIRQMTTALSGTSKSGKVLYVNGNHDYEPTYQKSDNEEYNSGAYIDGEMKEKVGAYMDVLYEGEERKSNLLAYYYKLDGIHYIGLNTPYDGDNTIGGAIYPIEAVEWVEKTLKKIPNDDLIIFLAHYPLEGTKSASKWMSNTNGASTRLEDLMLKYPNLIYLYGHDHGYDTGSVFIEYSTFERVTAYNADGSTESSRTKRASGFTSCFMGSLSYYKNRHNPGWLGAAQPKVIQALMIYVYEDHVELQMKNYGEETGIRKYPSSYSIPLKKNITSSVYDIDGTNGVVSGVTHNTTVEDFLKGFKEDIRADLQVLDFNGTVITDTAAREVRSNMTVQYVKNETVMAELRICVDKAAESDLPYTVKAVTLRDTDGNQVYALRKAHEITAVTVDANAEVAEKAVVFVGLYDEAGQMIRSAVTAVNGSGTYDISLPLTDLPEGAVWRTVVYGSLSTMDAVSYPMTSDEEHYALEATAVSAESELVLGGDQKSGKLVVFHQNSEDWNEEASVAWKWEPTAELGFDSSSIKYYKGSVSDAKLRYSDYYGGYVVVTCSGNCVCVVDYETGENLFSAPYTGNNLHAIELLPDGNIVTAGSSGNSVTLFAASQGDDDKNGNSYAQKYTFEDAHGLLWDPDLEVLWALGGKEVTAYKMTGTGKNPELIQQSALTVSLPTAGGHDLYPVYGEEHKLWVTTVSGLYQFDTDAMVIKPFGAVNAKDIKSIGNQPYSGTVVRTIADTNNSFAVWCTDMIELFVPQENGAYQSVKKVVNGATYYKARVWHYKYQ